MPTLALSPYAAGRTAGTLVLVALVVLLLLRAFGGLPRKQPARGSRVTDLGVAALLGVLLAGSLLTGRADGWDGGEGKQMRADFVAGCESSAGGTIDCACVFAELTSTAPYDTPEGFATLDEPLARAAQTGDVARIPAAYMTAVQRCVRTAA
jgi:hypothetical protein